MIFSGVVVILLNVIDIFITSNRMFEMAADTDVLAVAHFGHVPLFGLFPREFDFGIIEYNAHVSHRGLADDRGRLVP